MTSNLEINIRSLISQCEEMVEQNSQDWRLKKYIKSLDTMIHELEHEQDVASEKAIQDYKARCKILKETTNYIEPDLLDKKIKLKSRTLDDSGKSVIREIKQINKSKFVDDLRQDLLGKNDELNFGIRKRGTTEDMGQAVKYYSDMQEKIAEDMLSLTRNLKEQTETANKIIKKDTDVVLKSANLSEKNITSLSGEAEKLQDHSKRAWKCWMWLMIGFVMMIFIGK